MKSRVSGSGPRVGHHLQERDGIPLSDSLRPRGPVRFEVDERTGAEQPTHLEVRGELDILTARSLAARIEEILRRSRGDLVVDLCGVEFIDSAGLHVLLNAQRRITRRSRGFSVICEAGPVRRVIELARLIETLGVLAPGAAAPGPARTRAA